MRTCLIHCGAIGDFVLALRVVASLQSTGHDVTVEVLGRSDIAGIAIGRGVVEGVTSAELLPLHTLFGPPDRVAPACGEYFRRFDLIVNMYAAADDAFTQSLTSITRARVVTLDTKPTRPDCHITDGWLEDLRTLGLASDVEAPRLRCTSEELQRGRTLLQTAGGGTGGPTVVIHPGSGGRAKCWPVERFIELIDRLKEHRLPSHPVAPVVMLGPVELEQMKPATRQALEGVAPVLVEPDLTRAMFAVAAADAYVGNDAGMTHVAAAAGTPTVALFGPTDPVVWRPLGPLVTVLRAPSPHRIEDLAVREVMAAVVEVVGRRRT